MDDTVIVIMLKDEGTGFLEKELASYPIPGQDAFLYSIYGTEKDGKIEVTMKLTTDRDVEDWEFEAIYDYYDMETFSSKVTSIEENNDHYNPTWVVIFDFLDDKAAMAAKINEILELHKNELLSVFEAIQDKRDEY